MVVSLPVVVPQMRLLDRSVDPSGSDYTGAVLVLSDCVFCRCRGYSIHYIWRCRRCSSSSRTLTSSLWRRRFSHGPDFSAFPYSSPSCRTRSGCPGCAVASSVTGVVLSMYVAVLAQRQVPAALCAGWAPGPFIEFSVGSVSGVFCCGLVVVTPLSMMNVIISWAIQTVFVRRIICPCLYRMRSRRFCAEDRGFLSEAGQFPFGFASWRKGDPNVSVQRIETSFRKRRNSLFGFANWRKGDPNVSERRIEASFRKRSNSLFGNRLKCTESAPRMH